MKIRQVPQAVPLDIMRHLRGSRQRGLHIRSNLCETKMSYTMGSIEPVHPGVYSIFISLMPNKCYHRKAQNLLKIQSATDTTLLLIVGLHKVQLYDI